LYVEGHKINLENPKVTILHRQIKQSNCDINNLEILEILLANKYDKSKLLNDSTEFENAYLIKSLISLKFFKYSLEWLCILNQNV